jgi:hypothetical protein
MRVFGISMHGFEKVYSPESILAWPHYLALFALLVSLGRPDGNAITPMLDTSMPIIPNQVKESALMA